MSTNTTLGLNSRHWFFISLICCIFTIFSLSSSTTTILENANYVTTSSSPLPISTTSTVTCPKTETILTPREIALSSKTNHHHRKLVKRYEPNVFDGDRTFSEKESETPLTFLNSSKKFAEIRAINLKLPTDWEGGYGWIFNKYIPSKFEQDWEREAAKVEKILTGSPLCQLLRKNFSYELRAYVENLPHLLPNNGGSKKCKKSELEKPQSFPSEIFSRFEYVYKCTKPPCHEIDDDESAQPKIGDIKYTYIEPLVGLLRHPLVCLEVDYTSNKNYMLTDAWALAHTSRSTISLEPKIIMLDCGASVFLEGAGGASQSWFHKIYESMCFPFTDWFMWEAEKHDPARVLNALPGRVKPGYRWFNTFLSTKEESWDNPMNHLLVTARKEDVVIFKIDFDSPKVEMALIDQIFKYPEIAELIDELYFEHHVNVEILKEKWGTGDDPVYQSDSIKMFKRLRALGIRAHSWV